jgi:FG-GAP-like repeat
MRYLFRNLGQGRFEEIVLAVGVAVNEDGQPKASMGVDVGDFDNDFDLDIAIPVVRQEVFSLYRNQGALFDDVSWSSGMARATEIRWPDGKRETRASLDANRFTGSSAPGSCNVCAEYKRQFPMTVRKPQIAQPSSRIHKPIRVRSRNRPLLSS